MKKLLSIITVLLVATALVACQKKDENVLNVGVDFYPMGDLVELIKDDLKNEGITLNIKKSSYTTQNQALAAKELDINLIQHQFFMQDFNKANNASLVKLAPIYHSKFAIYSKEYHTLADVKDNAKVLLPSDSSNVTRSIYLLNQAGLINLGTNDPLNTSLDDIKNNPTINFKNLIFEKASIVTAPSLYNEKNFDFAIMYPTYIRNLKLNFEDEIFFSEITDDISEQFAISIVGRNDNKDSFAVKKFIEYITSDKVRSFLETNYAWASTVAF